MEYLPGKDINIPWMLIGDSNDISDADEKLGGTRSFHCSRFANWISSCNLIDLGFSGPRFTWSNLRLGHVKERLDRALSNADWRLLFPEAIVPLVLILIIGGQVFLTSSFSF